MKEEREEEQKEIKEEEEKEREKEEEKGVFHQKENKIAAAVPGLNVSLVMKKSTPNRYRFEWVPIKVEGAKRERKKGREEEREEEESNETR